MLKPYLIAWSVAPSLILACAAVASGQNYPHKSVRIVTAGLGGGSDFASRIIAQGLAESLGQPVIVDNRGAIIPIETVARASPDGYTLLIEGVGIWIGPLLQKMPYDPVKDFAPITLALKSPNVLVVHPSVQASSVKELIMLAKAKPGSLNYATTGTGGASHIAAELFKAMAGIKMVDVPYKSTGPALTELIAGQVQVMFAGIAAAMPHVKSGKLRALAVTSAQPSAVAPGLLTIAGSGVPGYESGSMFSVLAPAKTPEDIIRRLNREISQILSRPEVKERFLSAGSEIVASSPQQLAATISSDMARMSKVFRDAGIRAE